MAAPRARFGRKKSAKFTENQINDTRYSSEYSDLCWCPRTSVVFNVLLSARISAAFLSNISDCDETYNYWEPTHYLMYGNGFQTWEYSPRYALRSYAYLLLHVLPAQLVKELFRANKVTVFYYVRFILGIICAIFETFFVKALQYQFGNNVARLYFVMSAVSTGMFISAAAFLPSSFAMYCCLIAFSGWFTQNHPVAIFGVAAGALVGWPFFAIIGVPIAFDIIIRQNQFWSFVQWCVGIFLAIMIPVIAIDTHYYGQQVIAPMNIVFYNVFGQGGPDLYGVESWKFYFINGFLNFNIAFVMALLAFPFIVLASIIHRKQYNQLKLPTWLVFAPMLLWVLVFFTRPHKEERFLFPIYPLLVLSAALMLSRFQELYHFLFTRENKHHFTSSSNWLCCIIIFMFTIISLSRSSALFVGYHAPLDIYHELNELVAPFDPNKIALIDADKKINVCVGREWYRYPSSFFLPNNNWRLLFLKSDFSGQLPQQYQEGSDGTKLVPPNMNDMNHEEVTAYSPVEECDLLMDLNLSTESEHEENYSINTKEWKILHSKRFLHAPSSHPFFRAFYIPFISEKYSKYVDYNLLLTKRKKRLQRGLKRTKRISEDKDM